MPTIAPHLIDLLDAAIFLLPVLAGLVMTPVLVLRVAR